jgi:hypothetical protein
MFDLNCSLKRPNCYLQYYLSSPPRHLVLEFASMHFLVPIRRLTPPSAGGVFALESRQLKPLSNQICSLAFKRGLPRQVKGAGLRTLSRRGSWVQIPPPAPQTLSLFSDGFVWASTSVTSGWSMVERYPLLDDSPSSERTRWQAKEVEEGY